MGFKVTASKSQAAIEFLATYTWAIFVFVIVIGSLWYFGVLSPAKKLPDRCTISPYIDCKQYLIAETQDGTGVLRLKLKNNYAKTIHVDSWELAGEDSKPLICTGMPFTGIWEDGQTIDVEFSGCNSGENGLLQLDSYNANIYAIAAIQEQQKQIDALAEKNQELLKENLEIKRRLDQFKPSSLQD